MAKKNPSSEPRPDDINTWARKTMHEDGKRTQHQAAVEKAAREKRNVQDVLRQKFVAYHVNAGHLAAADVPPGREGSRSAATRRRGAGGSGPTEVRTDDTGEAFRTRVGAPEPTSEVRAANKPAPATAEEAAAAAKKAERSGGQLVDSRAAVLDQRVADTDARAGGTISSIITGPGGRGIRPIQQESLRDPGIITDAGPVHEGAAKEGQIEKDTKRNRGRLKKQRISGGSSNVENPETGKARGTRSVALGTAKAGGTSQGWEKLAVTNVPRDAKGNVIQGTLQYGTAGIQAVDQTTQEAHHVYKEVSQHMADNPRSTIGNMSQSNFELFRAAENHLLTHSTPTAEPVAPGATVRNDHLGRGAAVPAGSQAVMGSDGPLTRAAIAEGDAKAEARGNAGFMAQYPHPGTFEQYRAAQPAGQSIQFHAAGYKAALKAHEVAKLVSGSRT